jgi:hypothetical protein
MGDRADGPVIPSGQHPPQAAVPRHRPAKAGETAIGAAAKREKGLRK